MIGVTKLDCILVVVCSTLTFVVPSLILSYSMALVANHYLLGAIYPPEMLKSISILPDLFATIQALVVGLFIPIASSIVPIQRVCDF